MPYYSYTARGKGGKLTKGQVFALTKQQLVTGLQRDGLLILSVKESAQVAERRVQRMHKKAKDSDLILFAKEFTVLLENGIVITEALDVLLKQMNSKDLINATRAIKKDLENGASLANATAKNPRIFGSLWQYLVEAGETTGQLPFVLKQMVAYMESRELIRKKTTNALIYPALLVTVAIAAILIFTVKIIPIFKGVYATLGSKNKLPPLTLFIIGISDTIRSRLLIVSVGIVIVIFAFRQFVATKFGRFVYETILMHIPVLGNLYIALSIERFSTSLKVLLKSGIPIIKAIETAANTSPSAIFAEKIEEVKAKVIAGLPFSEALQQTALFPPLAIQLIMVAEKTGNFSGMFEEVSNYYHEVLDTAVTRFTTMIEPLILIVMGALIGVLVISMFLPIFKIANIG